MTPSLLAMSPPADPAADPAGAVGMGVFLLFATAMFVLAMVSALLLWAALRHRRRSRRPHDPCSDAAYTDAWAESGRRLDAPNPDDDATDIITPDDQPPGPRTG